jgi:hypothetical protein
MEGGCKVYRLINVKRRVYEVYIIGGSEAAYATYRAITGATVQESWKIVKKWIKVWEGKK